MSRKSNLMSLLTMMMAAMLTVIFISCGGDDENVGPNNGLPVNPGTTVNDPEGTISLSMRNADNGKTYLDNIYISNENFSGAYFTSVGAVKGLGSVSTIPTTGWAETMSVIEGYGYVAYSYNNFYRIYVVSDIVGTTGGVIGADIKYQKPFKGVDEAISINEKNLAFDKNGGSQSLVFNNKNFILFDVNSDQSWCRVQKSSTYDKFFLYNAITISVDANSTPYTNNAVVTLTTAYGRKVEVSVTRFGSDPILELAETESNISGAEQAFNVGLTTNYELDNIELSNSNEWLSAEIVDGTRSMQERATSIRFIGEQEKQITRAASNTNNVSSYYIRLKAKANYDNQSRTGQIILHTRDNKIRKTLTIKQNGADIEFTKESIEFECAASSNTIQYTSLIDMKDLQVYSNSEWCNVELKDKYINVSVLANKTGKERKAVISLSTKQGNATASLMVTQKRGEITFENNDGLTISNIAETTVVNFISPFDIDELKVNSDKDWCIPTIKSIRQISITSNENSIDKERIATVTLSSKAGDVYVTLRVTQEAATMEVQKEVWLDRNPSTITLSLKTSLSSWKAISNESWCTLSQSGNNLILRFEATNEDRTGKIVFEGLTTEIQLIQSKYAYGDEYIVNGISGKVIYMNGSIRIVGKYLGEFAWSSENVPTGATNKTDGRKNMEIIKNIPNYKTLYPAFNAVEELNKNGVTDWVFPAIYEPLGDSSLGFASSAWSSTECSSASANIFGYRQYAGKYFNEDSKVVTRGVWAFHYF